MLDLGLVGGGRVVVEWILTSSVCFLEPIRSFFIETIFHFEFVLLLRDGGVRVLLLWVSFRLGRLLLPLVVMVVV
jgi:hypothetical protein